MPRVKVITEKESYYVLRITRTQGLKRITIIKSKNI